MAQLQCSGESEYKGHVFLLKSCGEGFVVVRGVDQWWGPGGNAAGKGGVVVDVEF
jgi:hypothetical protein